MSDALVSYGRGLTILAERDAARLAVAHEGREVTRGELDRHSNRLARAYARLGVSKGDFVSVALPNSVEFVAESLRDDAGKVRRSALRAERLAD